MVEQKTTTLDVTEKDLQKAADFLVDRHDEHKGFMKKDDKNNWKMIAEEVHGMKSDLDKFSYHIHGAASQMIRENWNAEKYNCAEAEKMLKMAKDTLTNHKNAYDKCLAEQYALRNARNLEISGCECFT